MEEKLIIKRVKGEDGYKTFSIRIRDDLAKSLDEIAKDSGHSRNEIINKFLDYAVQNCVIEE